MADGVSYEYRGEHKERGPVGIMTIYEVRNYHNVYVWTGYRNHNSSQIAMYPKKAGPWWCRDGIVREKFTLHSSDLVYKKG
jgi:hypothetical protein